MVRSQALTLEEIARRLDRTGVVWAVFAGAAASVYGAAHPVTDVDIVVPAREGERMASLFPEAEVERDAEGMMAHLAELDWGYLRWRAQACGPPERVRRTLQRLEALSGELGREVPPGSSE